MLRGIVHKQVHVVVLAIHLGQFRLEIDADLGEYGTKSADGISVKDPTAILCDKDQMGMKLKNAVSTASNTT